MVPIVVLFGTVACGYYLFVQDAIENAYNRIELSDADKAARNAAEAGYVRGAQLLYESFTDTSFAGTYANDSFRVNVDVIGDRAVVSAVGRSIGSGSLQSDRVVRVEYRRKRSAAGDRPAFMRFAMLAGRDLVASDSLRLTSRTRPKAYTSLLQVNGCTLAGAAGITVDGVALRATDFRPCRKSSTRSTALQTDTVGVSTLYGDDISLEAHLHVDSDHVLAGSIGDGAPARSPFIMHVSGDLIIASDVTARGYVLILTDGDVFIRGNVGSADKDEAGESRLALYAGGSLAIMNKVSVSAQLYSEGDTHIFDEGAHIVGSVTSRRDIRLDGPLTIAYRPASPALSRNWVRPRDLLELVSYEEQ